ANSGRLSQEQVVPMMNVDLDKWEGLGKDLKEAMKDDQAHFDDVYLIDDFTASGTTFIRFPGDGAPKGKLAKFEKIVQDAREHLGDKFPLTPGYTLHIHHYISTAQARDALEARIEEAAEKLADRSYGDAFITEGLRLPTNLRLGSIESTTGVITPSKSEDAPYL